MIMRSYNVSTSEYDLEVVDNIATYYSFHCLLFVVCIILFPERRNEILDSISLFIRERKSTSNCSWTQNKTKHNTENIHVQMTTSRHGQLSILLVLCSANMGEAGWVTAVTVAKTCRISIDVLKIVLLSEHNTWRRSMTMLTKLARYVSVLGNCTTCSSYGNI